MEKQDIQRKLFHYLWKLCEDKALCDQLIEIPTFAEIECGTCILEAGARTSYIGLIISGLIRGFYIDDAGNDITKCFSVEGDWCCSYNYLSKAPSPFYIETLEDTVLAKFDIEKTNRLLEKYPAMQDKVVQLISQMFLESERRILSFTSMEAKDRYLSLSKERPELIKRVKQEQLASYIGVTPSSLSRLKKYL